MKSRSAAPPAVLGGTKVSYVIRSIITVVPLTIMFIGTQARVARSQTSPVEVWVSNYNPNNITGYTASAFAGPQPGDNPPSITISNGVQGPEDVTQDSLGNVWISNVFNGTVVGYAPPFSSGPSYIINLGLGS